MAYLGIPQNTIAVLQKYHFNFQKKFGQNFLIGRGDRQGTDPYSGRDITGL